MLSLALYLEILYDALPALALKENHCFANSPSLSNLLSCFYFKADFVSMFLFNYSYHTRSITIARCLVTKVSYFLGYFAIPSENVVLNATKEQKPKETKLENHV